MKAQFATGLTAYWNFDGNLTDQAHGLTGSASSVADNGVFDGANGIDGIRYAAAKFGSNAIQLNGGGVNENDGYVRIAGSADTHFGSTDTLSVSVWLRVSSFPADTGFQTVLAHGEGSEYRIARRVNLNTLYYAGGSPDAFGANGLPNVNDGQWHHVVGISEAGVNTRIYIDGVLVATGATPNIINDTADLLIGANPETGEANREWNGFIDDVALWNRVLSDSEITTIYNGGSGNSISTLVGTFDNVALIPQFEALDENIDAMLFPSLESGTVVGRFTADSGTVSGVTYSLVAGAGSTHNGSYTIGGPNNDELLLNADISGVGNVTHSIRVRGQKSVHTEEFVFSIYIPLDNDTDLLPDDFENATAGNLTDLTGLAIGPGPGANTGDFDGDTFSDSDEYLLGLPPTISNADLVAGLDAVGDLGPFIDDNLPPRTPNRGSGDWALVEAFPNLSFEQLKGIVAEPNSTFMHAMERRGRLQRVDASNPNTNSKTELLNIQSQVVYGDNGGLRSVAFHPEYNLPGSPNRNYFYAFYTTSADNGQRHFTQTDGSFFLRLSRFTRNESTGVASRFSELVMLQQRTRDRGQHFGGGLVFDTDGFLIVTIGDTEFNQTRVGVPFYQDSQRIDRIFQSSVLRLDVDMNTSKSSAVTRTLQGSSGPNAKAGTSQSCLPSHNYYHVDNFSGFGYLIPNDNYFKNNPPLPGSSTFANTPVHGAPLEEYQALGVRNPWRLAVDSVDGDIAIFNVGSNQGGALQKFEEVELLAPGANYGWPYWEGNISKTYETGRSRPPSQYGPTYVGTETDAITFYNHTFGASVTGGVFYRGTQFPLLYGKLIYTDVLGGGRVWALDYKNVSTPVNTQIAAFPVFTRQMATDASGEDIYFASGGDIFRLTDTSPSVPEPPALLSETNIFTDLATLTPHSGLLPYEVGSPLWSDRANKYRWIGLPNTEGGSGFDQESEKITFATSEAWDFPVGTTFIKHFELPLDEADPLNPLKQRRLETRFLVHGEDGNYFGFTYKWRADGSDADLLLTEDQTDIEVTKADGSTFLQTWEFPSRTQCFECHQAGTGHVLGVNTHQLNNAIDYANTGNKSNQLSTFKHLEIFKEPSFELSSLASTPASSRIDDTTVPLEHRVRSYMDSNCSMCHRPDSNAGRAQFDMRLSTPLDLTQLIDVDPEAGNLGLTSPKIIDPGNPDNSIAYLRDSATDESQMPPLARSIPDLAYTQALSDWIQQLGYANYLQWTQTQQVKGSLYDDDDLDGMKNIVEYVIGLDPAHSDQRQAPAFIDQNGDKIYSVPITGDALADGIILEIQDSTNLVEWFSAGAPGSGLEILSNTASAGVDGILQVKVLSGGHPHFIRLVVATP